MAKSSNKDKEIDEPTAQRKKQRASEVQGAKPSRTGKSGKDAAPAKASGPRQYSKRVEKLRTLCKQATITIPPTLYVKNKSDDELAAALEALLEKHGLSAGSGPNEVARAKQQLQTVRDLDGIDTSNIVEGGRRQRGGDRVSYRKLLEVESEEEEEDEEDGSQSSGSSEASGSEDEGEDPVSPPASRGGAAPPAAKASAGEGGPSPAQRVSPNENRGVAAAGKPGSAAKSPGKAPASGGTKKRRILNWSDDDDE